MDISFRKGEGRKGGQNGQKIVIEQDESRESRKKIHERELAALKAAEMAREEEMAKEKARMRAKNREMEEAQEKAKEMAAEEEKAKRGHDAALVAAKEAKAQYNALQKKSAPKLIDINKKIKDAMKNLPVKPSKKTKHEYEARIRELQDLLAVKNVNSANEEERISNEIKILEKEIGQQDAYNECNALVDSFLKEKADLEEKIAAASDKLKVKDSLVSQAEQRLTALQKKKK